VKPRRHAPGLESTVRTATLADPGQRLEAAQGRELPGSTLSTALPTTSPTFCARSLAPPIADDVTPCTVCPADDAMEAACVAVAAAFSLTAATVFDSVLSALFAAGFAAFGIFLATRVTFRPTRVALRVTFLTALPVRLAVLRVARAVFLPVLRAAVPVVLPALRATRPAFLPRLRTTRATLREAARATTLRLTLRAVLRAPTLRVTFRAALLALRGDARRAFFFAAIDSPSCRL